MSSSDHASKGADWTHLLSDPDLINHLGRLLQAYREALPEKRDQVLLSHSDSHLNVSACPP